MILIFFYLYSQFYDYDQILIIFLYSYFPPAVTHLPWYSLPKQLLVNGHYASLQEIQYSHQAEIWASKQAKQTCRKGSWCLAKHAKRQETPVTCRKVQTLSCMLTEKHYPWQLEWCTDCDWSSTHLQSVYTYRLGLELCICVDCDWSCI